jgi:hypothetical protein
MVNFLTSWDKKLTFLHDGAAPGGVLRHGLWINGEKDEPPGEKPSVFC